MVLIKPINKKILITSALPYVNNVPHLGNIVGCILSADVFARFQRSAGRETLYICGADEHGTTTETKAKEEGVTPQEICDKYYQKHREIYDWFNIRFDHFGRTAQKNHHKNSQEIFLDLKRNGFIIEKTIKQLYSEKSQTFLADRFIEGECPHCGYEKARGDQCDGCGKLLEPLDLKNPVSKLDGSTPIVKETDHLFLDLTSLQEELERWVGSQAALGNWTENTITTTKAWFAEGLEPRAITRDLKWGVPVPNKEGKVFYVWFDAPIGYISITEQLIGDRWKEWWLKPNDTLLYQFMGKDNIPFHSILFPATLIGTRKLWTLPHHINSTEYLNYEGAKFSKSNKVGVFGDTAQNTGISADVWRYYLLINRPESADTNFKWDDFQEKLNNELVANIGNLVNRTMTFIDRQFGGSLDGFDLCEPFAEFWKKVELIEQEVTDLLEEVKLKEALKKVMHLSKLGNQFFQEQEPWKTAKTSPREAEEALHVLANLIKDLAILIEPYLPRTTEKIFEQLNIEPKQWADLGNMSIQVHSFGKPQLLFKKLDNTDLETLKDEFAGKKKGKDASRKTNNMKTGKDKNTNEHKPHKPDEKNKGSPFSLEQLDLRVATITTVHKHPKADKLFIEELDVGPLGTRRIVSGLVDYYEAEELIGKKIILVANLKPAKLRGELSEGMLLAVESGEKVQIVPGQGNPGDQITIKGIKHDPAEFITIDDFFSKKYEVKNGVALAEGKQLLAKDGKPIVCKVDGNIS